MRRFLSLALGACLMAATAMPAAAAAPYYDVDQQSGGPIDRANVSGSYDVVNSRYVVTFDVVNSSPTAFPDVKLVGLFFWNGGPRLRPRSPTTTRTPSGTPASLP